ncbi:MAG: hypothetical protein ACK5LK_08030 [Chthoniobacterales bacterium]
MRTPLLRQFVCLIGIFALLFQAGELGFMHDNESPDPCTAATASSHHASDFSIDIPYSAPTSSDAGEPPHHHHCCTVGLSAELSSHQKFSSLNPSSKGLSLLHEISDAGIAASFFIPPRSLA